LRYGYGWPVIIVLLFDKGFFFLVLDKAHQHSLRKHEILRKRELISLLFSGGKSARGDFLRIVYASLKSENRLHDGVPALLLFTAGKKKISSAVRRNKVKRMMREAYRLERSSLACDARYDKDGETGRKLCIAFIYMSRRKNFPGLGAFRDEIRELMASLPPA